MNTRFVYRANPERAWEREVRFAVEVIDAVTMEPVWDGLTVKVKGLNATPIVSAGGRFVWLAEAGANPTEVEIDPGRLPYQLHKESVLPLPAPPAPQYSFIRLELSPTPAYSFDAGTTGVRGTLLRKRVEDPLVALPDVDVRLQWIDDNGPGPGLDWKNAPTISKTDDHGDFVAILRLATNQIARTDAQQRMRVRVAATHGGLTLCSPELPIRPGYVADVQQSFAWDEFQIP